MSVGTKKLWVQALMPRFEHQNSRPSHLLKLLLPNIFSIFAPFAWITITYIQDCFKLSCYFYVFNIFFIPQYRSFRTTKTRNGTMRNRKNMAEFSTSGFGGTESGLTSSSTISCRQETESSSLCTPRPRTNSGAPCWRRPTPSKSRIKWFLFLPKNLIVTKIMVCATYCVAYQS